MIFDPALKLSIKHPSFQSCPVQNLTLKVAQIVLQLETVHQSTRPIAFLIKNHSFSQKLGHWHRHYTVVRQPGTVINRAAGAAGLSLDLLPCRYGWQYTSIMILGSRIYRYILVYTHTSIYQYALDVWPTGQIHHPAVPVDQWV